MPEQSVIALVDLGLSWTPFLFVGATLAVIFSWLFLATRFVARLSPAEKGLVAVYTELCSARLNWQAYRVPLARVSLYADHIVLRVPFRTLLVPYSRILGAQLVTGLFVSGLRIKHNAAGVPRSIVIGAGSVPLLMDRLERALAAARPLP